MDIKMVNHYGHELFAKAIDNQDKALLDALMRIPGIIVSSGGYCALRHAVKKGLPEFVGLLSGAAGIRPNLPEASGDTALILAITGKWSEKKGLEMVKELLELPGIKVNFRGDNKQTALHHAITKRWYRVAKMLMDAGANPKIYDAAGNSPLSSAMMATDLPAELFTGMLSYQPPAPVEEIIEAMEAELEAEQNQSDSDDDFGDDSATGNDSQQDDAQQTPGVQIQQNPTPQMQTPPVKQAGPRNMPPKQQDHNIPVTEGPDFVPEDLGLTPTPQVQVSRAVYDEETFLRELGAADMVALEKEISKSMLMSAPGGANRILLHRPEVISGIREVVRILQLKGEAISTNDAGEKDPMSGDNLWHAAAKNDCMEEVLEELTTFGTWPRQEDLITPDLNGKSVVQLLEETGRLTAVLNSPGWKDHPELLVAVLASLPKGRRQALRGLVSRAHVMMLDQATA